MSNLDLSCSLYFIGSVNKLPKESRIGDVCICNVIEYVWSDKWQELGNVQQEPKEWKEPFKKMKPWICERCGAPMSDNQCRHCDTKYF